MNAYSFAHKFFIVASLASSIIACSDALPTSTDTSNDRKDLTEPSQTAVVDSNQSTLARYAPRMHRHIDEFIRAQNGIRGSAIVGIVPGAIAWQNGATGMSAVVDFAGTLFSSQVRDYPLAEDSPDDVKEPTYSGSIVEDIQADGSVLVTVELFTSNALAYAVKGMQPLTDELLFGSRNYNDRESQRADSRMVLVYRTAFPGAPIANMMQLIYHPNPMGSLESIEFTTASLREFDRPVALSSVLQIAQPRLVAGTYPLGLLGTLPAAMIQISPVKPIHAEIELVPS